MIRNLIARIHSEGAGRWNRERFTTRIVLKRSIGGDAGADCSLLDENISASFLSRLSRDRGTLSLFRVMKR